MPTPKTPDPRHAQLLVEEAAALARHLRPLCADWPEDRVADLAYRRALARLEGEVPRKAVDALRHDLERRPDAYRARLRERAD